MLIRRPSPGNLDISISGNYAGQGNFGDRLRITAPFLFVYRLIRFPPTFSGCHGPSENRFQMGKKLR